MYTLKDKIFDFFGRRERRDDPYKDVNGKGLHQRFNELLAGDLDDNELRLVNLLVENTRNPFTALEKFVPYLEGEHALPIFSPSTAQRRKFVSYISYLEQRRSTKPGYELMLQMLGFQSVVVVEHPPISGFDSPGTFDDPNRVFDQRCKSCAQYTVQLTGVLGITAQLVQSVLNVIEYNEPLWAELRSITYNGQPLVNGQQITMFVDPFGDLIFINPFDASFSAWIDANGDLIFQANNANFYSIDANGDLIFTT